MECCPVRAILRPAIGYLNSRIRLPIRWATLAVGSRLTRSLRFPRTFSSAMTGATKALVKSVSILFLLRTLTVGLVRESKASKKDTRSTVVSFFHAYEVSCRARIKEDDPTVSSPRTSSARPNYIGSPVAAAFGGLDIRFSKCTEQDSHPTPIDIIPDSGKCRG